MPKVKVTTPYQKAWSTCEPVKWPTQAGSTGMIRPIEIMSIKAVAMMNGIAAARPRRAAKSLKRDCVTESGAGRSGKRILNEALQGKNLRQGQSILSDAYFARRGGRPNSASEGLYIGAAGAR